MSSIKDVGKAVDYPGLDRVADPLSNAVRRAYEAAGPIGQQAKNALHGVWLGHPLHPVFTDVPIGAWTTALALDAAADGDPGMLRAATFALGVGLVGAAGAAVSGLTDWSETDGRSRRTGLIHGLLNIDATSLVRRGVRGPPQRLSFRRPGAGLGRLHDRGGRGISRRRSCVWAADRRHPCGRCRARRVHTGGAGGRTAGRHDEARTEG